MSLSRFKLFWKKSEWRRRISQREHQALFPEMEQFWLKRMLKIQWLGPAGSRHCLLFSAIPIPSEAVSLSSAASSQPQRAHRVHFWKKTKNLNWYLEGWRQDLLREQKQIAYHKEHHADAPWGLCCICQKEQWRWKNQSAKGITWAVRLEPSQYCDFVQWTSELCSLPGKPSWFCSFSLFPCQGV